MQRRDPAMVIVLMIVTCGIYAFYHAYTTTYELMRLTGRNDLNPGTELLLNIITCGLFGMFIEWRNQQIIDTWYVSHAIVHEERANMVGLMNLLTFVIGLTWLVATFMYSRTRQGVSPFSCMIKCHVI